MKFNLTGIDVRQLIIPAVFQTPFPKPQAVLEAEKGLMYVEQAVELLLEHGFSPEAIRLDDIADLMSSTAKKTMRREINKMQKIAYEAYDGEYYPPQILPAESLIYKIAANTIYECGRLSTDLVEYTVKTHFDSMFDTEAIETESDIACWVFLIEYFEDNLRHGGYRSFSTALTQSGSRFVSKPRMETFIKKNCWYGIPEDIWDIFQLDKEEPSATDVAIAGTKVLESYLFKVAEDNPDIDVKRRA